jgi:K+/H+ antiporter YhaU regulatory subunit KhtT
MIDHETHLKQIFESQRKLSNEISELTNVLNIKREQYTKMQGIVEYLTANGIKLEENENVELSQGAQQ